MYLDAQALKTSRKSTLLLPLVNMPLDFPTSGYLWSSDIQQLLRIMALYIMGMVPGTRDSHSLIITDEPIHDHKWPQLQELDEPKMRELITRHTRWALDIRSKSLCCFFQVFMVQVLCAWNKWSVPSTFLLQIVIESLVLGGELADMALTSWILPFIKRGVPCEVLWWHWTAFHWERQHLPSSIPSLSTMMTPMGYHLRRAAVQWAASWGGGVALSWAHIPLSESWLQDILLCST